MNHLAHCFLSFKDEDLLLGNFIGDFVKGNDWRNYPEQVQKGILLHRAIDSYTDNHPETDKSVTRIRRFAGRYAPPFTDILYDHLLAIHWVNYTGEDFESFAATTYKQLENRVGEMPAILHERLPKMIAGRFLHGYQSREGLSWVLDRFSLRLANAIPIDEMTQFFFEELEHFSGDFNAFFPDLLAEAKSRV